MAKIHKRMNKNKARTLVLFIAQIVLGVLPVLLLLVFIFTDLYTKYQLTAVLFILAMAACSFGSIYASRRYNILLSGLHGEKLLYKSVKRFRSKYHIFVNQPINYRRNHSELDLIMVGEEGVIIAEVKNHSGIITGHYNDLNWVQRKIYKDGKTTEKEIYNPLRQIKLQREIVKSIFRKSEIDVWVESILVFSSANVRLKLTLRDQDHVMTDTRDFAKFVKNYKGKKKLSTDEINKIVGILESL